MSEEKCIPRMTSVCGENELAAATEKGACPAWHFCLPFGGELRQKDGCVEYVPGEPPADGIYDKIVIVDGCIVALEKDGLPWYTATPCAPVPDDCTGGGGGIGTPSPIACNLLQYDASGRPYVCVTIQGGAGIDVVGTGTAQDPIIITNTSGGGGGTGGYVKACNNAISVTGSGSREDPYCVGHALADDAPQTAGGLSLDRYGHVIGYTPSDASGLQAVIGGDGIHTVNDPIKGTATVSLEDVVGLTPGTYILGNYQIVVDSKGRITSITRLWTVKPHTFRVDCVDYTVNENGVIEDIRDLPESECMVGGRYEVLRSHLIRSITAASWGSSDYTGNGTTPTDNAEVASFTLYSSDNTFLQKEWDNANFPYGEDDPFGRVGWYDIKFILKETSALFFRFWGNGTWSTEGNCGDETGTCSTVHSVTHWRADLDGTRIVDREGTCIMVRTKDVYAAGAHTLRIHPVAWNDAGVESAGRPIGLVEIMTTALYNKA